MKENLARSLDIALELSIVLSELLAWFQSRLGMAAKWEVGRVITQMRYSDLA